MKKIRAVEFKNDKKLPLIIIGIAVFMLLVSVVSVDISAEGIRIGFNSLASVISVLPLTAGVGAFMLIKTKKAAFGEFPCYIISALIVLAFGALFIFKLLSGFEFLGIMVCVLMVYPYIVAGLTVRGSMYNRLVSIGFSALLLILSIIAVVVVSFLLGGFSLTFLILPLMYTELILNVLCFDLKPLKKEKYDSIL